MGEDGSGRSSIGRAAERVGCTRHVRWGRAYICMELGWLAAGTSYGRTGTEILSFMDGVTVTLQESWPWYAGYTAPNHANVNRRPAAKSRRGRRGREIDGVCVCVCVCVCVRERERERDVVHGRRCRLPLVPWLVKS